MWVKWKIFLLINIILQFGKYFQVIKNKIHIKNRLSANIIFILKVLLANLLIVFIDLIFLKKQS